MILPDANLLLYAYNPRAAQHDDSRVWLESLLSGPTLVGMAWSTMWAFVRIATSPRVFSRPLTGPEATSIVSSWLGRPNVIVLTPGPRHWEILRELIDDGQSTGPLVTDAALAALAIEHGATLHSADRDFARFASLTWENPLDPPRRTPH